VLFSPQQGKSYGGAHLRSRARLRKARRSTEDIRDRLSFSGLGIFGRRAQWIILVPFHEVPPVLLLSRQDKLLERACSLRLNLLTSWSLVLSSGFHHITFPLAAGNKAIIIIAIELAVCGAKED